MSAAEAVALADVEARIERRAGWREGHDAGRMVGAVAYFQSNVMLDLALELVLLRTTVDVLAKQVEWYRGKLADAYHTIGHPRRAS